MAMPGPGFSWAATKVEVARSRDLAYETETCDFKTLDDKHKPITIKEKYLVVWKKPNRWPVEVIVDMDNTDQ